MAQEAGLMAPLLDGKAKQAVPNQNHNRLLPVVGGPAEVRPQCFGANSGLAGLGLVGHQRPYALHRVRTRWIRESTRQLVGRD